MKQTCNPSFWGDVAIKKWSRFFCFAIRSPIYCTWKRALLSVFNFSTWTWSRSWRPLRLKLSLNLCLAGRALKCWVCRTGKRHEEPGGRHTDPGIIQGLGFLRYLAPQPSRRLWATTCQQKMWSSFCNCQLLPQSLESNFERLDSTSNSGSGQSVKWSSSLSSVTI